jgi:glycosyltransferase involved in cell wall biosynthesis
MRILHVVDRLGGRGGAVEHLRGILAELVEGGGEVHVAAGAFPREAFPFGTTLIPGLDARGRRPVHLDAVATAFGPAVVHVHNVMNPAALEWASTRAAVVTVQDHRFFCPGRGKWTAGGKPCRDAMARDTCAGCFEDQGYLRTMQALTEARLRALHGLEVVVLSRYMKRELEAVGLDAARIHVIPPFVHGLDPTAEPDGPPCIGFAGRLARAKGTDDAVAAWRLSGIRLPLVFAGTGPERGRLEGEGFEVLGWLDRKAMSRFYRRTAAVLLPSRWQEPFGLVGIEALSLGTPVVAWDSGGVAEWCEGPGLVPWGDVEGLATALRWAVDGPRGRHTRFERQEAMARLRVLYNSMASAARPSAALR